MIRAMGALLLLLALEGCFFEYVLRAVYAVVSMLNNKEKERIMTVPTALCHALVFRIL